MKNNFKTNFSKIVFLLSLLIILAGIPMFAVAAAGHGAPTLQESPPLPSLDDLLVSLKNLGGVSLLFAALINAGKSFGWVKDDQAPTYSLGLNAAALVGLVVLQITGKADIVPILDMNAGVIATALTSVVALIYQLFLSRKAHEGVLSGMPVIGTSYTGRSAGEKVVLTEVLTFEEANIDQTVTE